MKNLAAALLLLALGGSVLPADECISHCTAGYPSPASSSIADIPLPQGYKRQVPAAGSFASWLHTISLKKDKRVFLYNGMLKEDQSVQYAVLNIPVGNRDLQQCADAIMRLRAEYLFAMRRFSEIAFRDNNGTWYKWTGGSDRVKFENYLQRVFGMCGTASLEKQLTISKSMNKIEAGDVFIKGGFPGHAMLVVDMAVNAAGKKIFLLAQSYMPAQDIHIVNNPVSSSLSPWYEVNDAVVVETPEWTFSNKCLRSW